MAKDEEVKKVKREVTKEDLELNPKLVEKGVQIGDIKLLPPIPQDDEEDEDLEDEDEDSEDDESDEDESDDEEEDEQEEIVDEKDAPITFKIRDNNAPSGFRTRTFSKKDHGKNYKDIAAQFESTNSHKKPVDLNNKEEVDECVAHNRNIKHPIVVDKK